MGLRGAGPFTPFAGQFLPRLARRPPSAPPLAAGWLAPFGAVPGGAPAMSPCTAGDRVCGCCVGGVRAAVPRGQPLRAFGAGVQQATGRRRSGGPRPRRLLGTGAARAGCPTSPRLPCGDVTPVAGGHRSGSLFTPQESADAANRGLLCTPAGGGSCCAHRRSVSAPPSPPVPASALAAAQWVRLTRSSGSGASRAPLLAFGCPPCEATFTSH